MCGFGKRTVVENFLTDCFSSLGERSGEGQTPIKTEGGGERKKTYETGIRNEQREKIPKNTCDFPEKKNRENVFFSGNKRPSSNLPLGCERREKTDQSSPILVAKRRSINCGTNSLSGGII